MFESAPSNSSSQKVRESLPGPGHIRATREALFNSAAQPSQSSARPTSAERFRRDMRLAAVEGAAFPDPPVSTVPKATHIASKPAPSYQYQQAAKPTSPIRSQSEVVTPLPGRFAAPPPPPMTEHEPVRTQSAPEQDIYTENTICMNMVRYTCRSRLNLSLETRLKQRLRLPSPWWRWSWITNCC